jgi:membrane protease YdiL (CAAX protease family)
VLQVAFRRVTSLTDLSAMFGPLFTAASARLHRPPEVIAARYLLFIQLWAGLGEETFYRVWVAATLLVGVAVGVLYERTRSLLPPILCHYAFNLLA